MAVAIALINHVPHATVTGDDFAELHRLGYVELAEVERTATTATFEVLKVSEWVEHVELFGVDTSELRAEFPAAFESAAVPVLM